MIFSERLAGVQESNFRMIVAMQEQLKDAIEEKNRLVGENRALQSSCQR